MDIDTCLFRLLEEYEVISFAGIDKNSGKTTALNKVIEVFRGKADIGLTSIGIDGEEVDLVTNTPKPRIFVPNGTIFATSKAFVRRCDVTKEVLEVTDINTPIGEVVLIRAKSSGFVEIAGPSTAVQSKEIIEKMKKYGANRIFVDGALSRKSHAVPQVADCVIISAGASLYQEMVKVVDFVDDLLIKLRVEKFSDEKILKTLAPEEDVKIILFDKLGNCVFKSRSNDFASAGKIMSDDVNMIFVKGAVLDSGVDSLIKNIDRHKVDLKKVQIVIEDGTKLFTKANTIQLLKKLGVKISAINSISVPIITANPTAPQGYSFKKDEFVKSLGYRTNTTVVDVIGGDIFEADAK